jgi:hypothetical protein
MNSHANGYDGPAQCVTADGTTLAATVNLHRPSDGTGLVGAAFVAPQFESKFADGDQITVTTAETTGTFEVVGSVLVAGQKAGCFVQVVAQ